MQCIWYYKYNVDRDENKFKKEMNLRSVFGITSITLIGNDYKIKKSEEKKKRKEISILKWTWVNCSLMKKKEEK